MSNTADLNNLTRTLKEGAQAMGLALSAAQIDKLMAYQALLAKWNKVYNLTALRDPAQMVTHRPDRRTRPHCRTAPTETGPMRAMRFTPTRRSSASCAT